MLVYLSGPMSGYPEWNYPAFNRAAEVLRKNDHIVINPAETAGGCTRLSRTQFLYIDVGYVQASELVVLLPGWEMSKGALLEAHIADELGKPLHRYCPKNGIGDAVHVEAFIPQVKRTRRWDQLALDVGEY
jgi:hypothetical protein